ncbi:hypothetical protein ACNOYE_14540 [Nannocystaceae bacterium ST9]
MSMKVAWVLALALLSTACPTPADTSPMAEHPDSDTPTPAPSLEPSGETVTLSVVGEFTVGHARIHLHNPGREAAHASVTGLWFEVDGQRRPLELGSVHDMDRGVDLDPLAILVAPGQTLDLLIGFPSFVHEPGFRERAVVLVEVKEGPLVREVGSPLRFERRIPKR